jgi:hypothetical protein
MFPSVHPKQAHLTCPRGLRASEGTSAVKALAGATARLAGGLTYL